MRPRDRIIDAAMLVFRRHGFRRSSIEQTAEAAGLTRQALYHHFESKEALFRAVIEHVHESALAAELAAVNAAEKDGRALADVLIAGIAARMRHLLGSFDGSPHIEELFSEHLLQARDLYQKYGALYAARIAETIGRVCRKQRLALAPGMSAAELARCVEMAMHGAKTANPGMQPVESFLRDLEIMVRTLVAGALAPPSKSRPAKFAGKKAVAKKSVRSKPPSKTPGGRR
ncbi:TetR/AcrR family transcriptional regulator [Bradyrhizobium lablabi]|uniref:TetR/AcrR family transcriptional regulator n=1 Tax=Bradyrhizobium lablabi TaxID=722472 RepID=UPI001BA89706|nr:TetR/AcrR family transcriptional regulator [Bradyrhizobium lablabi]MBR1122965.1 TetR/AcrR family transcriptional regulator [Bradyrhizobium lablabi]